MTALIFAIGLICLWLLICVWIIDRTEAKLAEAIKKIEADNKTIAKVLATMLAQEAPKGRKNDKKTN